MCKYRGKRQIPVPDSERSNQAEKYGGGKEPRRLRRTPLRLSGHANYGCDRLAEVRCCRRY